MVEIVRLTEAHEQALKEINSLIHQLSPRLPKCSMELLQRIAADDNLELWTAKDGERIVGMATLAIVVIPESPRAQIEDVVVDEQYRGQGLGERLSTKLIERAREKKIPTITLSSRADRVAANKLYQKLGFQMKETNIYRLKL
ncbi:MAG TPA: GNAT family N-acetyltransferase [Candidatus Paceibacterota bacterium]